MASASTTLLLKGGTILTHEASDNITPVNADLLIKGNIICRIAPNIQADKDTTIIDCNNKILCPGFIDTHHHVWQSLLKGKHADQLLLDYMYTEIMLSWKHEPADIFWGELGGVLECLDAGTTTVVDVAHMNYSPEHTQAAIAATTSSGLRSIFCYDATSRVDSWSPFAISGDLMPQWWVKALEDLALQAPFGNGRVELGFSFDSYFLPKEMVLGIFEKVRKLGIKLVTSHFVKGAIIGQSSRIALADEYGLLNSQLLFAHASNASVEDARLLKKSNAQVSCTPSTELMMALGIPIAFSEELDVQSQCSLGIDCHSATNCFIPSEMRNLLHSARNSNDQKIINAGKSPKAVNKTVQEAFNLGTIQGARAIGMEDKLGSLAEGKLADICVFDATSPSMAVASEINPVAAVVLHSSPRDVAMTIVDGIVRKVDGKLSPVYIDADGERWVGGGRKKLEWNDVASELMKRSQILNAKMTAADQERAREGVVKAFFINPSDLVDSVHG